MPAPQQPCLTGDGVLMSNLSIYMAFPMGETPFIESGSSKLVCKRGACAHACVCITIACVRTPHVHTQHTSQGETSHPSFKPTLTGRCQKADFEPEKPPVGPDLNS